MKKKVGLISGLSLMIAMLVSAIGFSFVGKSVKETPKVTHAYTYEQGVGLIDESNIVLSVTKVAVLKRDVNIVGTVDNASIDMKEANTNLSSSQKKYYYRDLPTDTNYKTVVANKSFVKLENTVEGSVYTGQASNVQYTKADIKSASDFDSTKIYYVMNNGNMVAVENPASNYNKDTIYYTLDDGMPTSDWEEAILITFGQEAYNGETVKYPINNLTVKIEHNGNILSGVPSARSEGYKRDFGFMIGQSATNEGHYKITIPKEYFNEEGNQAKEDLVYEFYLLNNSSYTGSYTGTSGNRYDAKPTLSLPGESLTAVAPNSYKYNLGESSRNYPLLTYDYTLFKMSYSHTLDGATAKYDYNFLPDTNQIQITKTYRNKTTIETKNISYANDSKKLVLAFSELGDYQFEFKYIYSGYPYSLAGSQEKYKEIEELKIDCLKLKILGFEVNFSKRDYFDGAEMKYVTFNTYDNVDLMIADGYIKGQEKRSVTSISGEAIDITSLGIMYDVTSDSGLVNGAVINNKTQDVNLITKLSATNYQNLYANILDSGSDISDILSGIKYETTDQNPIKLKTNTDFIKCYVGGSGKITYNPDSAIQGSFYIFNPNSKISSQDIFESSAIDEETTNDKGLVRKYTSDTSFNDEGYYLIFLAVTDANGNFSHYQIVAFNNILQDVSMKTVENIEGGKEYPTYTQNQVKLTWNEPGIFEMGLTISYYYKEYALAYSGEPYTDEEIYSAGKQTVENSRIYADANLRYCIIGSEISANESGKYIVVIENEKGNKWTTSFVIDKQPISGVSAYCVDKTVDGFKLKSQIQDFISNSKKDQFGATLYWNNKPSGAGISVTYKMIPFVSGEIAPSEVGIDSKEFTTSFETAKTIDGSYTIQKPSNNYTNASVDKDNVLFSQGVYVFELVDEAGNTATHMFILDNTPTYFAVTEIDKLSDNIVKTEYKTADWLQYNDVKVNVETPNYKLIKFADVDGLVEGALNKLNNANLRGLFTTGYIKVKQYKVEEYDSENSCVKTETLEGVLDDDFLLYISHLDSNDESIKHVYDDGRLKTDTGTSVIRTFYVTAANQKFKEDLSYIKVEINPDNAKGYFYYNTNLPKESPVGELKDTQRIITTTSLSTAKATNDNYVSFSWIMDLGNAYEVEEVKYTYYPLNLKQFNSTTYFFDSSNSETEILYKPGMSITTEDGYSGEGKTRGFVVINVENGATKPGYYILSRKYKNAPQNGLDVQMLSYHFIVDRNGIITKVDGQAVGSDISIGLLENEKLFKDFSTFTTGTPSHLDDGTSYIPSLKTNKLPAVMNIPVGKYNDGSGNYSNYFAGKLNFTMYYRDITKQLSYAIDEYKLFSVDADTLAIVEIEGIKYYNIDIAKFIENSKLDSNNNWVNVNDFIRTGNNSNWICLPGDYVVVISDRTIGSAGANKKVLAFTISSGEKPTTPVYVTPDIEYTTTNITDDTSITSSQRYIKIDIPFYNQDKNQAQIDTIIFGGQTIKLTDIIEKFTSSSFEILKGIDKYTLILDTMPIGENIYSFEKDYKFTVVYKLGNNRYRNCYYDYNFGGNYYHSNEYTISIDRTAPEENIENLSNDTLNKTLVNFYGAEELFEQYFYDNRNEDTSKETTSYFVYRYKDYYNNGKNKQNIFAFAVKEDTQFIAADIVEVLFKPFNIASDSLNLPANNLNQYIGKVAISSNTTFGTILAGKEEGYYEILEIDAAGNTTQYVVIFIKTSSNFDQFELNISNVDLVDGTESLIINNNASILNIDNASTVEIETSKQIAITSFGDSVEFSKLGFDNFYVLEVFKNGNKIAEKRTNLVSNSLGLDLISILREKEFGNYTIKLYSRQMSSNNEIYIDYTDKSFVFDIDSMLKYTQEEGCFVRLDGANEDVDGVHYYFKEINITKLPSGKTDSYTYDRDRRQYKNEDTQYDVFENLLKFTEGSYSIEAIDMFDISKYLMFNARGEKTNYIVNSEDDFYKVGSDYYAYKPISIKFVKGMYDISAVYAVDNGVEINITDFTNGVYYDIDEKHKMVELIDGVDYETLNLYPYFPEVYNEEGKLVKIKVELVAGDGTKEYTINFDTRSGKVNLTDTDGKEQKDIVDIYENADKSSWNNTSMTSGVMNLSWSANPTQYFDFEYCLYEKVDDGENVWQIKASNEILSQDEDRIFEIITSEGKKGLYAFEIKVLAEDGKYLGNKVYVFMVKAESSKLFTVQSNSSKEFIPNSILYSADLASSLVIEIEDELEKELPNDMPMYIANEVLSVIPDRRQGVDLKASEPRDYGPNGEYTFIVYRVFMSSFDQYLAVLQPKDPTKTNDTLIEENTLKINGGNITKDPIVIYSNSESVELKFNQIDLNSTIARKNLLRLEISFNGKYVKTVDATTANFSYIIKGSGQYTFRILDLAGNVHIFEDGLDYFDVYVLANEVAVLMNGNAVIENGYFSQAVQIAIVNDGYYNEGISVSATRNGKAYSYSKNKQVYTFTQAGTYRVEIKASRGGKTLSKVIIFTIINPKETSTSINLNLLDKYNLVKVLNGGEDITDLFVKVIKESSKGNLVTYEALKNADTEGRIVGKQNFVMTYYVSDGIYPDREQTFSFSLSNEVPAIKCSLNPGESSKKNFIITFNAGLIYEQIGEAVIYINDEAYYINEKSPIEIKTITVTEKKHGAGTYNIKLVSGDNILYSQTVKLREPLNASAIIIIVVVSAVVIAGVVTFIVLRRKMRIR